MKSIFIRSRQLPGFAFTLFLLPAGLNLVQAAAVLPGNVTTTLGPTFFVDDAATGGSDATVTQPAVAAYNRSFAGLLSANHGLARVTLTGFGFATSILASNNTATSLTVTFTYLGADEAVGGGDDVVMGSATGTYAYLTSGEYVFAFDTPITAELNITGTRFRIQVTPSNETGNGKVLFKTAGLTYETASGPKFSVSGTVAPLRLNLAKYQAVTTDSVSGQRLATYVTDGVAGNDNRWQSTGNAPHWARVTFPFPVEVASAQVFSGDNDGNAMTSYKLQYLNNTTWVDVPGGAVSGNTNVENHLVFTNPVTASAFRIYNSVDATIRIRELALYPPGAAGAYPIGTDLTLNLAKQRPVTATANTPGNFALLAVDGRVDKASKWQTSTAGTNSLDIDLIVATKVGSAHLYSGSPGIAPLGDFDLKYWDGAAWQTIPGGSVTGNTSVDLVVSFSPPVTTSKVRLEFTNPGTTSIRELSIFPANTGNTGYPLGTGVTGIPPSLAKVGDYADSFYQINNPAAGNLAAVDGSGQPILNQSGLTTEQGQYQVLLNISNGTYRLRNRATGNCLSGAQLSKNPGELLTDAPYSALPHQDWILDPLDGGAFQLINLWSGLAIDVQGGGTAAGTPLVQNTVNGSASQRWEAVFSAGASKKGIGGGGPTGSRFIDVFKANWMYSWGLSTSVTLPDGAVFNPMQWGNYNWTYNTSAPSTWKLYSDWRTNAKALHLMGFNEPDHWAQSGDSLDTQNTNKADFSRTRSMEKAVELWPRLQAMDLPLVAPAPAGMTNGWMADFYTRADAQGYRVDYTPTHTYGSPGNGSANGLINGLLQSYTLWGRPMWLTEFSFVSWDGTGTWTEEDNYNSLAEFLWRAESLPWLHKYALFVFTESDGGFNNPASPAPEHPWSPVGPRSNSIDINGNLTAFGKLYAAWDCEASVVTDKSYYVHNRKTRKRLSNTLNSTPGGSSIRTDDASVRWTLVATGTTNLYYLVSARDGRRLSSNGTSVSQVAAGTTGTAVEWSLTENQHGWYYLGHPATSKRLRLAYNNSTGVATYTMAGNTNTDDESKWRFIVSLPPPSWTGAGGSSWTAIGNWTSSEVPSTGDTVSFDSSSTANLTTVLNQDFSLSGIILTTPVGPVSIGGANSLTLGAGGIDLSGASQDLTMTTPVVLGADQSWTSAAGRNLSVNGGVSGSAALSIGGAGIVSLGGSGTWSGDTAVAAGGTLRAGAANVLPYGSGSGNLVLDGTLDLNSFPQNVNGLSGSGIVDNLSGGAAVLTIGNNDTGVTLNATLQNTSGTLALVKTGTGVLTLNSANSFAGGFTNNGTGIVYPKDDAAFGTGSVTMNAATLYATGGVYSFANPLTLGGATLRVGGGAGRSLTWTGPVTVTANSGIYADGSTLGVALANSLNIGGATFTSFASANTNTISGAITGVGGMVNITGGTLNLEGAGSYTGASTLTNSATLRLLASASITGDVVINGGGNFNIRNTVSWVHGGTISGDGTGQISLNSGTDAELAGNISGVAAINANSSGTDTTISGDISGITNVTVLNSGGPVLRLSGSNSYSGSTTLNNSGALVLAADNTLSGNSAMSIANATLNAGSFANATGTLDVTSTATIHLQTGGTLAFADSSEVDWTGGSLTITGAFVSGSSIRFGTDSNGLTSTQLALISAAGVGPFALSSSGYLSSPGYTTWASINAPTGTASDDFDGDGVANGVEYVLGGDKDTNDLGKLPQVSATGSLVFSFQRDASSIDGVTTLEIEVGTDLVAWPISYPVPDGAAANNPGVTVVKNSPAGFDTVTLTLPLAPEARKFIRLNVKP